MASRRGQKEVVAWLPGQPNLERNPTYFSFLRVIPKHTTSIL